MIPDQTQTTPFGQGETRSWAVKDPSLARVIRRSYFRAPQDGDFHVPTRSPGASGVVVAVGVGVGVVAVAVGVGVVTVGVGVVAVGVGAVAVGSGAAPVGLDEVEVDEVETGEHPTAQRSRGAASRAAARRRAVRTKPSVNPGERTHLSGVGFMTPVYPASRRGANRALPVPDPRCCYDVHPFAGAFDDA